MKKYLLLGVASLGTLSIAGTKKPQRINVIPALLDAGSASTRTVAMRDSDVMTIHCRPRHNTLLVFQDGGQVSVASGGDVDKNRWVIDSPSSTKRMNILNVKPSRFGPEAQTDLNVMTTEGHTYTFLLDSCERCAPDVKVFISHKDDMRPIEAVDAHLAEIERLASSLDTARSSEKRAVEEARKAEIDAAARIDKEIGNFRRDYPLLIAADYSYKHRNSQPFRVLAIWADDKRTYIQLAGELTSIYTWVDGKPALTQYTYNRAAGGVGGTYVIEGVLNSGYLQLGKNTKLRFERLAK